MLQIPQILTGLKPSVVPDLEWCLAIMVTFYNINLHLFASVLAETIISMLAQQLINDFVTVDENSEIIPMPLHDACRRGNVSFLEEAISNGVSVNVSY